MKRISLIICLFLFILPAVAIDWESKGIEMVNEIVSNPAAFFYDFQQDLEATSPLPCGKNFGLQTGLFPSLLPMGYLNGSLKISLHKEGRLAVGVPQIDLIGGYQSMILAKVAAKQSKDIADTKFNGNYYGLLLTSSVTPKIRIFYGYKHSKMNAKLNFAEGSQPELLGVKINDFNTGFEDDFIIVGIETLKKVNNFWSIQLNYGLKENLITTKVSWYGKWFEFGINIYPEGVFVLHPTWNFHLNF
ncbi:MAG: hypothetical protein ACP5IO_03335 [Elusimicrobiales bacterium]